MIAALVAYGVLMTVLCIALVTGAVQLRRSERASNDRALQREREFTDRAAAIIDTLRTSHREEVERLNAVHTSSIERLLSMQQFGTATPPEAVVTAPEPDAETRLIRSVSQDMIDHGAAVLQQEYEKKGVIIPIEELRDEAHSMILGVGFTPKTDRHLRMKD